MEFAFLLKDIFKFSSYLVTVELENRLLSRFDFASQKRELSTMRECAKILSQVNK